MNSVRRKVIAFGALSILFLFLILMGSRFVMGKMEQGRADETAVQTALEETAESEAVDEPKVLYFLMGHKMAGTGMRFTTELTQAGFLCRELDLTEAGEVPEDASLLLICGPLTDIGEEEEAALEAYAGGGGDLMVFLDGDSMVLPNLEKFLAGYGVAVKNGVLLDPKEGYFEEYEPLLLCDLYYSEMTKRVAAMKKKYPMPMSRAFLIDDGAGLRTEPILQTSGEAYIFSFAEESGSNEASFREEETGKYLTAAWIRRKEKKGNSDLVVFGSAQVLIAADQMEPEDLWGDPVELLTEVVMNLTK
ncbi:MAG: Gldg family protein [Lachnospiraceae bacterium]|nr:Gldg family protein [Lachnospiraceae bacterium]